MIAAGIILLPMAIIILQEDMGSALVYTSLSLCVVQRRVQGKRGDHCPVVRSRFHPVYAGFRTGIIMGAFRVVLRDSSIQFRQVVEKRQAQVSSILVVVLIVSSILCSRLLSAGPSHLSDRSGGAFHGWSLDGTSPGSLYAHRSCILVISGADRIHPVRVQFRDERIAGVSSVRKVLTLLGLSDDPMPIIT